MEGVPRLPMLTFQLKTSPESAEFGPILRQYIQDFYNEDGSTYKGEINELEGLRASAVRPSHDFTGCSTLKKYFCQLHFLKSRFPMGEDDPVAVTFTWTDVYAGSAFAIADIKYEMACVLYNIGVLHAELGASDTRQSADGMKIACTHFQCAAWAFEHLRDAYPQPKGTDMAHDVLSFMFQVTLAQGQECILEKSMVDNRKANIIAKVAVQIVEYYRNALKILGSSTGSLADTVGGKLFKKWQRYCELKTAYYECVSLLHQGQQVEEQQKMGERVAYYQAAFDKLNEAMKIAKGMEKTDIVHDSLTFTMDVVGGKLNVATKENEFVYHEKVPEKDSLPVIKGAALVKGIPFSVTDQEISGKDIFGRLVPMEAHEASSLYSEEKAKVLRRIGMAIEEKEQELATYMASLQLEQLTLFEEPDHVPQELVECCAALSANPSAIPNLVEAMNKLSSIYHDVESMLTEVQAYLEEEKQKEEAYQAIVGPRPPSNIIRELSREAGKYQEAHKKASESNETLHRAMSLHVANLRLLSMPLTELRKQLPTLTSLNSEATTTIVNEMKHLQGKVHEMQTQRHMLESQLREAVQADDITKHLVTAKDKPLSDIFAVEIKKHDRHVALIEQNLLAQDNILRALTEVNARFAETRRSSNEIAHQRGGTIEGLLASFRAYEDLLQKSSLGMDFYKKLETNVVKLHKRVASVCKVQDEEREQVMSREEASKKSNNEPKLKDYLNAMQSAAASRVMQVPSMPGIARVSVSQPMELGTEIGNSEVFDGVSPKPSSAAAFPSNYAYNYPAASVTSSESHTAYTPSASSYYSYSPSPSFPVSAMAPSTSNTYSTVQTNQSIPAPYSYPYNTALQPKGVQPSGTYSTLYGRQAETPPTSGSYAAQAADVPTSVPPTVPQTSYASGYYYPSPSDAQATNASTSQTSQTTYSGNYYSAAYATYPYSSAKDPSPAPSSTPMDTTSYPYSSVSSSTYYSQTNAAAGQQALPYQQSQQAQAAQYPQSQQQQTAHYSQPQQQQTSQYPQPQQQQTSQYPQSQQQQQTSQYPQPQQQQGSQYPHSQQQQTAQYPQYQQQVPAAVYEEPQQMDTQQYQQTKQYPETQQVQGHHYSQSQQLLNQQYPQSVQMQSKQYQGLQYGQPKQQTMQHYQSQQQYSHMQHTQQYQQQQMYQQTQQYQGYEQMYPLQYQQMQQPLQPQTSQGGRSLQQPQQQQQNVANKKPSNVDLLADLDLSNSSQSLSSVSASPAKPVPKNDLLSESGGIAVPDRVSTPVLQPKVLTAEEIQRQKEEKTKQTLRASCKDPYADADVLSRFVQEVEKLEKFVDSLNKKTLNGPTTLDLKWKELQDLQEKDAHKRSISVARCYPMKNRYPDILPYDHSRVELPSTKDDYINASHIKDLTTLCPPYIAAQAPLMSTYTDFWSMVWEQQAEIVVCLLSDAELKNQTYWPKDRTDELQRGRLRLSLQSTSVKTGWIERIISLTHIDLKTSKVVIHLQFVEWPATAFPSSPSLILQFITEIHAFHEQQRSLSHPVVVHCLAGVGRTGCLCLVSACLLEISAGKGIPEVVGIAARLSQQRKNIMHDREHLRFAYQSVLYYAQDLLMKRGILSNRSVFEDKPKSGHTRHPSEDFILAPTTDLNKLQSKIGLGQTVDNGHASVERMSPTLADSVQSEHPKEENGNGNLSRSSSTVSISSTNSLPNQCTTVPQGNDGVPPLTDSSHSSPLHSVTIPDARKMSLPPSLANLDPSTFTLAAVSSSNKQKITKESFQNPKGTLKERKENPDDPLSQLDPLWSLNKNK